jgi:hypothetical protein
MDATTRECQEIPCKRLRRGPQPKFYSYQNCGSIRFTPSEPSAAKELVVRGEVHLTDGAIQAGDLIDGRNKMSIGEQSWHVLSLDSGGRICACLSLAHEFFPSLPGQASMLEIFQPESHRFSAEKLRRLLVHRGTASSLGFGRNVRIGSMRC